MSVHAAARACPQSGCPEVLPCPAHTPSGAHAVDYVARRTARPYIALYRTARWLRLRRVVLAGEPTCRMCRESGRVRLATEVDHIVPWRGNTALAWRRTNLQGLCAPCHGTKTREEQR